MVKNPYKDKWELSRKVRNIYLNQKSRGQEGFGLVVLNYAKGRTVFRRIRTKGEAIFTVKYADVWEQLNKPNTLVLFHNRLPTSTENNWKQNQPIANESLSLFLVHNGTIYDHYKQYNKLKKKGHKFETYLEEETLEECKKFESDLTKEEKGKGTVHYKKKNEYSINDTEVIVHTLEEKGVKGLTDLLGSMALIWADINKFELNLLRSSEPLIYYQDKKGNYFVSSEFPEGNKFKDKKEIMVDYHFVLNENGLRKQEKVDLSQICWNNRSSYYTSKDFYGEDYYYGEETEEGRAWDKLFSSNGGFFEEEKGLLEYNMGKKTYFLPKRFLSYMAKGLLNQETPQTQGDLIDMFLALDELSGQPPSATNKERKCYRCEELFIPSNKAEERLRVCEQCIEDFWNWLVTVTDKKEVKWLEDVE